MASNAPAAPDREAPPDGASGATGRRSDGSARPAYTPYLRDQRLLAAVVALAVSAMLLPAVLTDYAAADDAAQLWMAVSGEPVPQFGDSLIAHHASGGRPILGIATRILLALAGGIEGLWAVRALAIVGTVILALVLWSQLERARLHPVAAAAIAVLICSVPGFQLYTIWAVLGIAPVAAVLSGLASVLVARGVTTAGGWRAWESGGAAGLLLAALWIYQPAAMFFWVFLAIAVVGARDDPARARRLGIAHGAVAVATLGAAFISVKAMVRIVGADTPGAERGQISFDLLGRLRWFTEEPLYQALNLFDVTPTQWEAALVAGVAVSGILLWLVTHGRQPWLYAGLAIALVPLSYLPNLVLTETWPPLRTQTALSGLFVLYASLGVAGLWVFANERVRPGLNRSEARVWAAAPWAVALLAVLAGVWSGRGHVTQLGTEPLHTELQLLRAEVRSLPPDVPRVTFVLTDWYGGLTDVVVYDEFGLPFSARPWAPEPMVRLILREQGRLTETYPGPQVDNYRPASTRFPAGQPLLDLRGMRDLR